MAFRPVAMAAFLLISCTDAMAQDDPDAPALDLSLVHMADVIGVRTAEGGSDLWYLDNLDLVATADLGQLIGWSGAVAHAHVLNNLGGMPNDAAGALQGVDNIEVPGQRLRLFEAWLEQRIGRTSIRAGLYDLNSEFYANDAAGLLIAPAFGVGSEIAATGPNGPSIFPSTGLALRVEQQWGRDGFVRAAVLNASAGTLGDPDGVDLSFSNGALLIGEAGVAGSGGKLALGAWGYTEQQDDIFALDADGAPVQRRARGFYVVAERPLGDPEGVRATSLFARIGLSDGRTTPFRGGWQAGVLVGKVFAARPDSRLSLGMNQAWLSDGYRQSLRDTGLRAAAAETAFEITYADRLTGWLSMQPDFQVILNRGGEAGVDPVLVAGLRMTVEL